MILNGPGISYTEPDIGAEFVPPLPEHPREKIVKLCEIACCIAMSFWAMSTGRLPRLPPTSRQMFCSR